MSYLAATKFGDCSQCGATQTPVIKVAKSLYCVSCHKNNKTKVQIEKAQAKQKVQRSLSSLKSISENKELVENKTELNKWFEYVGTVIKANPNCWNCGEWIPDKYYRHASAHIFPKALFPSVATHPINFLILGAGCGCHHEFDSSIEKACKMQVWKKSVSRFKEFEDKITETHKYLDNFKSKI